MCTSQTTHHETQSKAVHQSLQNKHVRDPTNGKQNHDRMNITAGEKSGADAFTERQARQHGIGLTYLEMEEQLAQGTCPSKSQQMRLQGRRRSHADVDAESTHDEHCGLHSLAHAATCSRAHSTDTPEMNERAHDASTNTSQFTT